MMKICCMKPEDDVFLNTFHANISFLYTLNTSEKLIFSGYRKDTLLALENFKFFFFFFFFFYYLAKIKHNTKYSFCYSLEGFIILKGLKGERH